MKSLGGQVFLVLTACAHRGLTLIDNANTFLMELTSGAKPHSRGERAYPEGSLRE